MRPDRIVIGTSDSLVAEQMRELYLPFNRNHDHLIVMDVPSAELTKYATNAMLATKINFMNEIANIAERVGIYIEQLRKGIGSDSRIDYSFIYLGAGYGGSCFPKDVQALARTSDSVGYRAEPALGNGSVPRMGRQGWLAELGLGDRLSYPVTAGVASVANGQGQHRLGRAGAGTDHPLRHVGAGQ